MNAIRLRSRMMPLFMGALIMLSGCQSEPQPGDPPPGSPDTVTTDGSGGTLPESTIEGGIDYPEPTATMEGENTGRGGIDTAPEVPEEESEETQEEPIETATGSGEIDVEDYATLEMAIPARTYETRTTYTFSTNREGEDPGVEWELAEEGTQTGHMVSATFETVGPKVITLRAGGLERGTRRIMVFYSTAHVLAQLSKIKEQADQGVSDEALERESRAFKRMFGAADPVVELYGEGNTLIENQDLEGFIDWFLVKNDAIVEDGGGFSDLIKRIKAINSDSESGKIVKLEIGI